MDTGYINSTKKNQNESSAAYIIEGGVCLSMSPNDVGDF